MRCPDCNRMVSYNTEEDPEANIELDNEGHISGDIRRVLTCGECGTELKETTFDIDQDAAGALIEVEPKTQCPTGDDHEWDWETADEPSVSPTEGRETTDRRGKKITNPRYMKTLYGVMIDGEVKCKHCPAKATYSFEENQAASSFDELT
jgi:hypothetical protein